MNETGGESAARAVGSIMRKTTQHVLDAIIESYLAGATQKESVKQFGLTKIVCRDELKRRGVSIRDQGGPKHKFNQEQKDLMIEAYLNGESANDAAALIGGSKPTCLDELRRRGITARPSCVFSKIPTHILDAIVADYILGASSTKAAAKFGLSPSVCTKELISRGIERRGFEGNAQNIKSAIVEAYLNGSTAKEASARFGQTYIVCLRELKKRAIKTRTKGENAAIRDGVSLREWEARNRNTWPLFMSSKEYKEWRLSVFERDEFTCRDCNRKGLRLQAHHIFRRATHAHLALLPENGVTLCKQCHKAVRGKEEILAERYARKIGSTVRPLSLFDKWHGKPNQEPVIVSIGSLRGRVN